MGRPPKGPVANPNGFARRTWKLVSEAMDRQDVSREELQGAIGISAGTMSDWSRWKRAPKAPALAKAARYLRLEYDDVFGTDAPAQRASDKLRKVSDHEAELLALYRKPGAFRDSVEALFARYAEPKREKSG